MKKIYIMTLLCLLLTGCNSINHKTQDKVVPHESSTNKKTSSEPQMIDQESEGYIVKFNKEFYFISGDAVPAFSSDDDAINFFKTPRTLHNQDNINTTDVSICKLTGISMKNKYSATQKYTITYSVDQAEKAISTAINFNYNKKEFDKYLQNIKVNSIRKSE